MAPLSSSQRALQARFDGLVAAAAPVLDVVLAVGERISRIAEPTDHEYYPIRPDGPTALPPGRSGTPGPKEPTAGPRQPASGR
jgi:hypothetical protein